MLFIEVRFLAFMASVFVVSWSIPWNLPRKLYLLLVSYFFYAAWDPRFLGLILLSTGVDYLVGLGMGAGAPRWRRRALLLLSLGVNLGLLGIFKYHDFFVSSAAALLATLGLAVSDARLHLILPVGISFYTFQTLSYTLDVYAGRLEPTRNPFDFALFVAFFPQLVAGPIVRAVDFLPQLGRRPRLAGVRIRPAMLLFLVGFFKKACLGDNLAPYVDAYFAAPEAYGPASAWLACFLLMIQIYCDFSGYSDMAIALASLLGYRLCRNFDHPLISRSLPELWRRWHISLGSWLRDYVYVPLVRASARGARATMAGVLTFFLVGLWHGASWNFAIWGLTQGAATVVHRAWKGRRPAALEGSAAWGWVANLITLAYFAGTGVFFRGESLGDALRAGRSLLLLAPAGERCLPGPLFAYLALLYLGHQWLARSDLLGRVARLPRARFALVYGLLTAAVVSLMAVGARPFVYFQF